MTRVQNNLFFLKIFLFSEKLTGCFFILFSYNKKCFLYIDMKISFFNIFFHRFQQAFAFLKSDFK